MKATFEGMEVSIIRQIDANWYVVSLAGAEFTANVSELVGMTEEQGEMKTIKSVMPIQRSNEWQVRIRLASGAEVFKGEGARYTMHQAQMYSDSIRRDLARGLDIVEV